jgi:hypothetical protein
MAGPSQHDDKLFETKKCWKFIKQLPKHQLLNNDSTSRKLLVVSCKWMPALAIRKKKMSSCFHEMKSILWKIPPTENTFLCVHSTTEETEAMFRQQKPTPNTNRNQYWKTRSTLCSFFPYFIITLPPYPRVRCALPQQLHRIHLTTEAILPLHSLAPHQQ